MPFLLSRRLIIALFALPPLSSACSHADSASVAREATSADSGGQAGSPGLELAQTTLREPSVWTNECGTNAGYQSYTGGRTLDRDPPSEELCLPLEAFTHECAPARLKSARVGEGAGGAGGSGIVEPISWEPPVDSVSECPAVRELEFQVDERACGGHDINSAWVSESEFANECCYGVSRLVRAC